MTVIDDRQVWTPPPTGGRVPLAPAGLPRSRPVRGRAGRPGPSRPAVAPVQYRGTGVPVSRAAHAPRKPVSTAVTVALAGLAALITVWLGSLAHLSAPVAPARIPDQLAVVRVQAGETLQQVAARVAPQAPIGQVMAQIRDLNELDSSSLEAGQTLIAPLG